MLWAAGLPSKPCRVSSESPTATKANILASFETSLLLNCTAETVFDFLVRPANVLKISPPEMQVSFFQPPEVLELGSRIEFEVRGYGQAQQMIHEITQIEVPTGFTEQQVKGPMKHWIHEHVFESAGDGGITVIDRIEFEPPGGLLGFLLTESRIVGSLQSGFAHRHRQLKQLLETNAG